MKKMALMAGKPADSVQKEPTRLFADLLYSTTIYKDSNSSPPFKTLINAESIHPERQNNERRIKYHKLFTAVKNNKRLFSS